MTLNMKAIRDLIRGIYQRNFKFWGRKIDSALAPFAPITFPNNRSWFSPIVVIAALLVTITTIGLAIGSFFTLFGSLILLYFVLTKILGLPLDLGGIVVV